MFYYLSLLLPICPFDLVLSSKHLHCKNRRYLNIYFEVRNYQISNLVAGKISESILIQHLSVLICIGQVRIDLSIYHPSPNKC